MPGIKDRAAIAGAGYSKYGERWDADTEDLLVEAVDEACEDAGITYDDIDAIWSGIYYPFTGMAGTGAADPLKIFGKPSTRVENYCASGMDAFRNACYAVASGVVDVALACGVEKITDMGSTGLPTHTGRGHPVMPPPSAPAMFALAASRSFHVHGWTKEDIAHVAVKNHENGTHHPKAHFRKAITLEQAVNAPMIAWPLGRFDCCAVSDGAAAVIVTRPETAEDMTHGDDFVKVKANALAVHTAIPMFKGSMDYLGFPATKDAAAQAYEEAGITEPAKELSLAEVHDCFTITEILNYQDLGLCKVGEGVHLLRDGETKPDGTIPVNVSGGLKCFGHPIGSTGCRMIVELTKQLQNRADGVQVPDARLGLAHNLGGPGAVCSVTILGRNDV